jgi:hypothetical protein
MATMHVDRALFLASTAALATAAFATSPPAAHAAGIEPPADANDWPAAEGGGGATPLPTCGHSSKQPAPTSPACTGLLGVPGDCTRMNTAGSCNPFPFPTQQCQGWLVDYKPGVAQKAVACAVALTKEQYCDACYTYRCGYEALMDACADPGAQVACAAITKVCPSASLAECVGLLNGMSVIGQGKMVKCMSEASRGCKFGLYSCSEGV